MRGGGRKGSRFEVRASEFGVRSSGLRCQRSPNVSTERFEAGSSGQSSSLEPKTQNLRRQKHKPMDRQSVQVCQNGIHLGMGELKTRD